MQAAGGLISMTGEPGRPGVRVGSSLIDQGTGTWAALGVLAALLERERTGEGTVVDVSLYETALGYIGYHLAGYLADGTVPHGQGTALPDGGAVPGVPHARRRADDRGRQRPALRGDLRRRRPAGARRRSALPEQPRPRATPGRALCDPGASIVRARHGALAGRAEGGRRPRGARGRRRRRRRRHPRRRRSGCCSRSAIRRSPTSGSSALPLSFDGERALHRSAPPAVGEHTAEILREARLRRRRDRGARRGRGDPSDEPRLRFVQRHDPGAHRGCAGSVRAARERDRRGGRVTRRDRPRPRREGRRRCATSPSTPPTPTTSSASSSASGEVEGVEVERVSDRTFLMHLGGKIEMQSKVPVKTRDDLSMAYTPGVARICQAIARRPRLGLEPDDQAEHRRGRLRRHRRARPRRHRAQRRRCR